MKPAVKIAAAVAAVAAAAAAWYVFVRVAVPPVPTPAFEPTTDPAVVRDVTQAQEAVRANPRSAEAWGEYGMVLRAYEFHPAADTCLETAANLDPADGRWPYYLGDHVAKADAAAAVPWFQKASDRQLPENAAEGVRLRLVETLLGLDRTAEAQQALAGMEAKSARARIAAARAAAAAGDATRAAELLTDLADHPTAGRQVLLLQAQIYKDTRPSFAADAARRAATAPDAAWPDPLLAAVTERRRSRGGLLDRAAGLLQEGRPREALKVYQPLATAASPDVKPFLGLAEAHLALGDPAAAAAALDIALQREPKNVLANSHRGRMHYGLAEQLWAAGRKAEARAEVQKALPYFDAVLETNPTGSALLLKAGAIERILERPAEGIALIRKFVEQRPEVGEGHLMLGIALENQNYLAEAEESYRKAADLAAPGDNRARQALTELSKKKP